MIRGYVCICLCWDIPWSPSAVGRAVEVISEPGTLVNCEWPAGVSKSSTAAAWPVGKSIGLLIGRMLACSPRWRDKAMASWQGSMVGEDVFGADASGRKFGTTLIDGLAGAGGARTFRDGIDTGGYLASMGISIVNVETYEMEYPLLYLYRRQQCDGAGAGTYRGGTSISKAFVVHGVEEVPDLVLHCVGAHMPMSGGMYGGYPAGTHQLMIKRGTDVLDQLARSHLPARPEQVTGELEVHEQISRTRLGRSDVYFCSAMGAGGYGDPIARDPELVMRDLANGLVSQHAARDLYGVVCSDGLIDADATARTREDVRRRRLREAEPARAEPALAAPPVTLFQVGPQLLLLEAGDKRYIGCACGRVLAPASENYKTWVAEARRPLSVLGPACDPFGLGRDEFELREYYCPSCGVLLEADMLRRGEPIEWDLDLSAVGPSRAPEEQVRDWQATPAR